MMTFEESGLKPEILSAISAMGFVKPTDIQAKTIPLILNSERDLIALAQTGTGKTAGFSLPIIQQIDENEHNVQALILCPTRELCLQITRDIENYSKDIKKLSVHAVYGGARIDTQIRALKGSVQIVVGTPGRTLDLINRKFLKVESIQWLVLDEADEMLNMGFREELDGILANTPSTKQTLLFSATMPDGVRKIASKYMKKPEEVSVGVKNSGADEVTHHYYIVKATDRYNALKRIADINPNIYGIVFCRTRQETKDVAAKLMEDGYNADALHGDLSQSQRDNVMQRFRGKQLNMLVATDVAARGIDVNDLTHVINYNLPDELELYVHRSGRTGRAGKEGISIIISHTREGRKIRDLEKMLGKKFQHKMIPSGREICEKRLFHLVEKIEKIEVNNDQIDEYFDKISKKLSWLDRDELLKRFISVEFNTFLEYYKNTQDINAQVDDFSSDRRGRGKSGGSDSRRDSRNSSRSDSRGDYRSESIGEFRNESRRRNDDDSRGEFRNESRRRNDDDKYSRFFINLGEKQNIKPQNLIGMINDRTQNRNIGIGKIEIMSKFSFFEVEKHYENLILDTLNNSNFGSTQVVVELSKPDPMKARFGGKQNFSTKDSKPKLKRRKKFD